jgi:serine/threonine protein phosphatase 1
MIFIIGDIHGEISKLKILIRSIIQEYSNVRFVFIGDYLDKGEDPFETLSFLTKLETQYECTFLMGNHEYIWMNLNKNNQKDINYLFKYGGGQTVKSLQVENIWDAKKKLVEQFPYFFSNLKPFWKNDDYVVVHSGISPQYYDEKIENIPLSSILFSRYEFIKTNKFFNGKFKIIFGHTGFFSPYVDDYKIGIDTAACFFKHQPLTAYCPQLKIFIDSNKKIYSIKELAINQCPSIPRTKPWRTTSAI